MRRFRRLLVLVAMMAPVIVFAGPSEDVGAVIDRWATAFNSNDVDALVNLYAPDAILVGTAGLTLNEGNEAVRSYYARLAKSGGQSRDQQSQDHHARRQCCLRDRILRI